MRAPAPGPGRRRDRLRRRSGGDGPALGRLRARARLHVVDLDGAFAGTPRQTALVARDHRGACADPRRRWAAACATIAARRGACSTRARAGPSWARGRRSTPRSSARCATASTDRIIVGVDASDGRVAVDGWTRVLDLDALALARDAAAAGAAAIIYTDIARDGTEIGPNLWSTEAVARAAGIPVFASGGVGSLDDIRQLAAMPGVAGVIVGPRALHRRRRPARRRWPTVAVDGHALQARDPVPRRQGRPRGQGRALRRPARRRRSRWRRRWPTTPRAPTSWSSSTSPPRTRSAPSCSTSCGAPPRASTCRSPWAAASARSTTSARSCARAPTRCRSTPPRSRGPS